jgi:Rrf2 family protein
MRLSAKTEYASLAMLELARRQHDEEPVRIREIADAHGVPSRFLVQILLQLKAAGLVTSTRGASGGYRLARDAAAITLADIREVIEGGGELVSALRSDASQSRASEVLLDAWQEAARCERDTLCSLDLATLAARTEVAPEGMYYI